MCCIVRGCNEPSKQQMTLINGSLAVCDEHIEAAREIAQGVVAESNVLIERGFREIRALGSARGMADPGSDR